MQKRYWLLLFVPVVVQSVALFRVSYRFESALSRSSLMLLASVGMVAALIGFWAIYRQERSVWARASRDWSARIDVVQEKTRNDLQADLSAVESWIKIGETRRALGYIEQVKRRLDEEEQYYRWLDSRVAVAVAMGRAIAAVDGVECRVEFERMSDKAPFVEGLDDTLVELLTSLSDLCKRHSKGSIHLKCLQKSQKWQIKIMCSAMVSEQEAKRLVSGHTLDAPDYGLRSSYEIDKGLVLTLEFPKRQRGRRR